MLLQNKKMHLPNGLHVNVSGVERQFLAAPWTFAIETLNDFVWRSELNALIENRATL